MIIVAGAFLHLRLGLLPAMGQSSRPHANGVEISPIRLTSGRHGHAVLPLDSGWLVCGGFAAESEYEGRGTRDALWCDRKTHRWRELARLNVGKSFFGAAVVDGQAYAVGSNIERYDAVADRWEVVCRDPALPTSHFSAASIGSRILIVAHRLFIFDTRTQTLTTHDLWPTRGRGDHFHVVAALREQLHVIGGLAGESFDPQREHWVWTGTDWKQLADAPGAIFAKFSVIQVVENQLYVLSSDGSYSFDAEQWKALARMPATICMPGSLVHVGKIQLIGGLMPGNSLPRLSYDLANDRWLDN
jgi:N-acetylneuraminic acid mutarotase